MLHLECSAAPRKSRKTRNKKANKVRLSVTVDNFGRVSLSCPFHVFRVFRDCLFPWFLSAAIPSSEDNHETREPHQTTRKEKSLSNVQHPNPTKNPKQERSLVIRAAWRSGGQSQPRNTRTKSEIEFSDPKSITGLLLLYRVVRSSCRGGRRSAICLFASSRHGCCGIVYSGRPRQSSDES